MARFSWTTPACLVVCLAACGSNATTVDAQVSSDAATVHLDAAARDAGIADAANPDAAMPDAAIIPDDIVMACAHACTTIATCFGQAPDPTCNAECAEDLADCTAHQVRDVDACSPLTCDSTDPKSSPFFQCLIAITCVEG